MGPLHFSFGTDWSYITKRDEDDPIRNEIRERAGDISYPEIRGNVSVNWAYESFFASWYINYISSQENLENLNSYVDVGDFTSHNVQFGYSTPWDGKITLGARNLFDTEADMYNPTAYRGLDTALYNPLGRTLYVRLEQTF